MVLYYLSKHAIGLSEADLARLVRQDRAAVTRTVAKLERSGLVERPSGDSHSARYRAPVRLTGLGTDVAAEMDRIIDDVVRQASGDLEPTERTRMYDWLSQVLERLEAIQD